MKITLLKGSFSAKDLQDIITQMIHAKIKYHEKKIADDDNEETVKMREKRIITLQKDLYELREALSETKKLVNAEAEINISIPVAASKV
jgi:hypothetical protein